ncbi:MAG: cation-transporting P-type ATPase, partial [Erysipelotrichaceae bacterium]|nr:cation-transporting P-type ATPase [Erysipelotrichaceae bacterium]
MEKNRKTSIDALEQQLTSFSMMSPAEVFERFGLNNDGLNAEQIEKGREKYGENIISTGNENSIFTRIRESLINPFNVVLLVVIAVSYFTDVVLADVPSFATIIMLIIIVLISSIT